MVRPNKFHKPGAGDQICCNDDMEDCDSDDTLDFGDVIINQMSAKNGTKIPVNNEHVFKIPLSNTHLEKVKDFSFLNGDIINMAIKSLLKSDEHIKKSKKIPQVVIRSKTESVIKRNTNNIKRKLKSTVLTEKEQNETNCNQGTTNNIDISIQDGVITKTKGYFESTYNMKPLLKSENHENIDLSLVVLSQEKFCKLFETPCTPYQDQYIIIYDVQINEMDTYELNDKSLVTEHYMCSTNIQYVDGMYYSLKDPDIYKMIDVRRKLEVYCCCWCLRERFINALVPIHPVETIEFMRKQHQCVGICKCCCRLVKTKLRLPPNKAFLKGYKMCFIYLHYYTFKLNIHGRTNTPPFDPKLDRAVTMTTR